MQTLNMLSIMKQEQSYRMRYAVLQPYAIDRQVYCCPDEASLITFLQACALDAWEVRQAITTLRKGQMAIVPLTLPTAQAEAYFPLEETACISPWAA
jgi:hypothetical protein